MRLVGASFASRADPLDDDAFQDVMKQAVALLRGGGLPPEAAENRARLLSGFRCVLVDECLDVGREQYEMVAAIAGPSRSAKTTRTSTPSAAPRSSVRFIRRFEQDYGARIAFLTDNYRCTAYIVVASNTVIESGRRARATAAGRFCEW